MSSITPHASAPPDDNCATQLADPVVPPAATTEHATNNRDYDETPSNPPAESHLLSRANTQQAAEVVGAQGRVSAHRDETLTGNRCLENPNGEKLSSGKSEELIQEQNKLLSSMITLLREMNDLKAADNRPIPPVPEHSSSAWNPLMKSVRSRIDPILGRWHDSLDVLLIFVGLFSAIVTSFFVDSVQRLSPDQATRTNDLLVNLTEIVIQLSGQAARLNITLPEPFVPDASDIRINAYWSLSLVISISAAGLAVAGRAFLGMLTKSDGKPHDRLVDIHRRWKRAEQFLGPALDTLPVIITIPVILFLVGLFESVFAATLESSQFLSPIRVAVYLSAATIFSIAVALSWAFAHAILHPKESPFRTTLSQGIRDLSTYIKSQAYFLGSWIWDLVQQCFRRTKKSVSAHLQTFIHQTKNDVENPSLEKGDDAINQPSKEGDGANAEKQPEKIEAEPNYADNDKHLPDTDRTYHENLQLTHEDDLLDQATAAFRSLCENSFTRSTFYRGLSKEYETVLSSVEIKTLVHLLSPEASYRCNLTASESILRLDRFSVLIGPGKDVAIDLPLCSISQRLELLDSLRDALHRERSRPKRVSVWESSFIQSFAVLAHRERESTEQHDDQPYNISSIVGMLDSNYIVDRSADGRTVGHRVTEMTFSVLYEFFLEHPNSEQVLSSVFDHSQNANVDSDHRPLQVAPLTATMSLCRWSGSVISPDVQTNDLDERIYGFISSMNQWIWTGRGGPRLENVFELISWGLGCGLWVDSVMMDSCWLAVMDDLRRMTIMKSKGQSLGVPAPAASPPGAPQSENATTTELRLLKEILLHLGASNRLSYKNRESPISANTIAVSYAFSAVVEILARQPNHIPTEDQYVETLDAVSGLKSCLAESGGYLDVAECLSCWDGRNIFARSMDSDSESMEPESRLEESMELASGLEESKSHKVFISAIARWLWKDVSNEKTSKDIDRLTANTGHYRFFNDVLMALIRFKCAQTGSLDLAVSVIKSMTTKPPAYGYNLFSLTVDLVSLVKQRSLSREQIQSLVALRECIRPPTLNPWLYSWELDDNKAAEEKQNVLSALEDFHLDPY